MKAFFRQPVVWAVIGAVLTGLLIVGLVLMLRPHSPVSDQLRKKVGFPILYPDPLDGYDLPPDTVTYDSGPGVLVLHAKKGKQDLTLSEQATPDPFNDIPDYYPKFVEQLQGYVTFDTPMGKVSLARPTQQHGAQVAIFNGKGTLMFVKPSKELSENEWRAFFAELVIDK
ncbi:MAG TPA: hypothetical protein VHQ86_02880 [Candidatus Saccharimonadia bacterium]|jgi:hypothetical protein|nr:hypothetical protein [Candidatus Saccharimonadia bacterium]